MDHVSTCFLTMTWWQMLAGESIPAITLALFDRSGAPCCGEAQVAVRIKVLKAAKEYELLGFADMDSTPGGAGSRMSIEFSRLQLVDRMAVGEFNVTANAFYNGAPLEYTV